MRFGSFSLQIPEGIERQSGHVHLPHGQVYTLQLGNHCGRRCQAEVNIDGKLIGTFILAAGQNGTIERAPHDRGRFTFYADATAEAQAAGLAAVPNADRGLIQVAFTPEMRLPTPTAMRSRSLSGMPMNFADEAVRTSSRGYEKKTSGGITGLSGHSDQEFHDVAGFPLDEFGRTVLSLRLVLRDDSPRPLTPQPPTGNPVPAPVG